MGRKKIEITKILDPNARQVCFSKRRGGLFKKASELSILCGAEIAVLVFSQAGKVFSFGHPNVDYVIDKHLHVGDGAAPDASQYVDVARIEGLEALEQNYNGINEDLINEKDKQSSLAEEGKLFADPHVSQDLGPGSGGGSFWWQNLDVNSLERWALQDTMYALDNEYERVLKHLEAAQNHHAHLQSFPAYSLHPDFLINPADLYHTNYAHNMPFSRFAIPPAKSEDDEANGSLYEGGLANVSILSNAAEPQALQQTDYNNYSGRGGGFNLEETCQWTRMGMPEHYHAAAMVAAARDATDVQDVLEAVAAANSIPGLSCGSFPQELAFPAPY